MHTRHNLNKNTLNFFITLIWLTHTAFWKWWTVCNDVFTFGPGKPSPGGPFSPGKLCGPCGPFRENMIIEDSERTWLSLCSMTIAISIEHDHLHILTGRPRLAKPRRPGRTHSALKPHITLQIEKTCVLGSQMWVHWVPDLRVSI